MEGGDTRWPGDVAPSPAFLQLHYTFVVGRQADDLWPLNGMLFCDTCYSGRVPLDDPGGPCRSCIAVFLSETCSFRLSSSVFWDVVSSPAYVFSPGSFPPGTPSQPQRFLRYTSSLAASAPSGFCSFSRLTPGPGV